MTFTKRFISLALVLLFLLGAVLPLSAQEETEEKIVIVLDPGHGGIDGGTARGLRSEKVYALLVGQYLQEALSRDDRFEVVMTREDDTYLRILPRILVAKDVNADLVVSLHFNSLSETYVNGSMAYCSVIDKYDAGKLAGKMLDKISDAVDLKRGRVDYVEDTGDSLGIYYWNEEKQWDMPAAWQLGKKSDYYSVCTWASKFGIPSIIVEHAYLSNPQDAALIDQEENLKAIAEAEAEAIIEYFTDHTHTFGDTDTDYPSSCTLTGTASRRCSVCNMKIDTVALPAAPDAHYWRQTASKAGDCLNPGYIDYVCQISFNLDDKGYECPVHTYHQSLAGEGHQFVVTEDTAPGHGVDGVRTEVCQKCGEVVSVTTPGEPHAYTVVEETAPTCTEEGRRRSICSVCNGELTEAIPPLGHDYTEAFCSPSTATEEGYRDLVCSRCDYREREFLPACAHVFASETAEPTCTEEGLLSESCTLCIYEKKTVIPATGHRYTTLSEKAATCTEAGLYRGVCDVCAQEIDERYEPLGHSDETVKDGLMSVTVRCTLCQREERIDKPFAESALPFILVGILLMLIPVCVIGAMLYARKRRQKEEELRRRRFTEDE